jgi:dTDP-3-amino-3,4,6-trideoxy-alpha-D-glucose transaminase
MNNMHPMSGAIPFVDLRTMISDTEPMWRPALEALLERAQFVLGRELTDFEAKFAAAVRAGFAVGVASGTSAIELSLRACTMRPAADEVITTPLTAPFTAVAIVAAGYKLRFADVDDESLLLDPAAVEGQVTARTAAIIPVHLYGQPYDLCELRARLSNEDIEIVQDACQAHGADCNGTAFTDLSKFVAYSFYPTKNLGGIGDGGAVVTNDASAARLLKALRDGGRGGCHVSMVPRSSNARLDNIQACFLQAWLPCLSQWNARRRKYAELYEQVLTDCEGVRLVSQRPGSVFHLFVIRAKRRNQLRAYLSDAGIETGIHYPVPLHRHPAFRESALKQRMPVAEKACAELLSLPLRPTLSDDDVLKVAEHVRRFYRATPCDRRGIV